VRRLWDNSLVKWWSNECRFSVYAKGESGLKLPYFVTILWYEPLEWVYSWWKVCCYSSFELFMFSCFHVLVLPFFVFFVNEMDGWNKWMKTNLWPQLSQDWPIHHFNHRILFHFCWFYRVESIGYLIKWRTLKWMKTLKTLAKMGHWESWKIKSIHPTSILEMRFDD